MEEQNVIKQGKQTKEHLEIYAKNQLQMYKLTFAEKIAKFTTFIFIVFFISLLSLLVLISLSFALALFLGKLLQSYALAALIVGFTYVFLAAIVYASRKSLFLNPMLKSLIKEFENQ